MTTASPSLTAPLPPASVGQVTLDEARFCAWLAKAGPGTALVYYRGHLTYDRMPSARTLPEPLRLRLSALARRALQCGEDGLVHLVQRRHGDNDFSYVAIARRRTRKPAVVTAAQFIAPPASALAA